MPSSSSSKKLKKSSSSHRRKKSSSSHRRKKSSSSRRRKKSSSTKTRRTLRHPKRTQKKISLTKSRWATYNQELGECRWPIDVRGFKVEDCNFKYDIIKKYSNGIKIVEVPRGTLLYHSMNSTNAKPTGFDYGKNYQRMLPNPRRGFTFFTSTFVHSGNFTNSTHVLEYKTKRKMLLIYEQNISQKYGPTYRGNEYFKLILPKIAGVIQKDGYDIVGYMGCNECEIAIVNEALPAVIKLPPKVIFEKSSKFFD